MILINTFLTLYNEMCQHIKDRHNSFNQYFLRGVIKSCVSKRLFKLQGKLEHKKSTKNALIWFQITPVLLTFKKLSLVELGFVVVSKKNIHNYVKRLLNYSLIFSLILRSKQLRTN